jgi:hypothetical protein
MTEFIAEGLWFGGLEVLDVNIIRSICIDLHSQLQYQTINASRGVVLFS